MGPLSPLGPFMKIEKFEDLDCWKQAKALVKLIYKFTSKNSFIKDFALRDQTRAAGISIMNNIAEGFDSQSNSEFIRFLVYSRRSVSEVRNCFYIALDQSYITSEEFTVLFDETKKTRQIIDGFLRYLRANKRLSSH